MDTLLEAVKKIKGKLKKYAEFSNKKKKEF